MQTFPQHKTRNSSFIGDCYLCKLSLTTKHEIPLSSGTLIYANFSSPRKSCALRRHRLVATSNVPSIRHEAGLPVPLLTKRAGSYRRFQDAFLCVCLSSPSLNNISEEAPSVSLSRKACGHTHVHVTLPPRRSPATARAATISVQQ